MVYNSLFLITLKHVTQPGDYLYTSISIGVSHKSYKRPTEINKGSNEHICVHLQHLLLCYNIKLQKPVTENKHQIRRVQRNAILMAGLNPFILVRILKPAYNKQVITPSQPSVQLPNAITSVSNGEHKLSSTLIANLACG
jgi:hypothetical protein